MSSEPSSPPPQLPASIKGKRRDTPRVSFAPSVYTGDEGGPKSPSERSPLLARSPVAIGAEADEEEEEEETEEAQDEVGGLPSRLHRKFKKGLLVGGGKLKKAGEAFPIYRGARHGDDANEGELTTQKALLYCVLALVGVAIVLGGVVLVQSSGAVISFNVPPLLKC